MGLTDSNKVKLIKSSTLEAIETFCRRNGHTLIDIEGRLKVIELRVKVGRNTFFTHIVFNPWQFDEKPPIFEIMNVDLPISKTSLVSHTTAINAVEGRYRVTFNEKCTQEWIANRDLGHYYQNWIEIAIEQLLPRITFRNLRTVPGVWNLHFPNAMKGHLERIQSSVSKNNLVLYNVEESIQYHERLRLTAEMESLKLNAKKETFRLNLEKAKSANEITVLIKEFGGKTLIKKEFSEVLQRISQRIDECSKQEIKPLDFEDESFTADTTYQSTTKVKGKGHRRY